MNFPSLFIAATIASMIGLTFHLVRGGPTARLILYLITAWVGFLAGHIAGNLLQMNLFRFGSLNLFTGIVGCILSLFLVSIFVAPQLESGKANNASDSGRSEQP